MNNDLYQHELVWQLAREFGLPAITDQDLSAVEILRLLALIKSDHINPEHYSPAEWVNSFCTFLRQTGKYPNMLESPLGSSLSRSFTGKKYR